MDEFEDDFGDLYADVEVQASSAINSAVVQAFPLELNSPDDDDVAKAVSGGDDADGNKIEEAGVVEAGVDDNGSDSEDDLNIVLNSDDDGGGTGVSRSVNLGGVVVEGEDEERDSCGGGGIPGLCLQGNGMQDKVENVGGGGGGGERGNGGGKGGYHMQHSQYKYVRSHSAVSGNKAKENGCAAISPYSYSSLRADREDNGCGRRAGSGSAVAQIGNNFSLPRSRTILDVNIDIFERKPWRHPGADITDFFNFGFDEESWKHYCNQLDEYRHSAAIPTRVLPFESFKSTEAYEVDNETMAHEVVREKNRSRRGRAVPSAPCEQQSEMQKGRAIQVEDSIIERKPSMDVRRALDRDSDVIQINVQDSRENSSGTVKEDFCHEDSSLREVSDNEGNGVDESGEFLCFSTDSEDELNSESLEGHPEGMDIPVAKRSSKQTTACPGSMNSGDESHQISDVDGHHNRIVVARGSEGSDGGSEIKNKTKEKAGGDTCTTDPSIVEPISFQRAKSQHYRRSSYSVSHSEAIEDGCYIGTRKSYCHIKRPSTNSISEFRKSARSERYDVKRRPTHSRYRERHRSPVHPNKRIHGLSKLKDQFDNKDNIPLFDAEGLYGVHLSTVDHRRAKERLPAVDPYYEGRGLSYQKECEPPFDYYGERFSDYEFRNDRTEGLHRKGFRRFGAERDQFVFRKSNEGGDFLEEELSMMDEEMTAMDWYHYESRLDVEDVGPLSNQELEQLNFQYSSYLDDERGAPWNRKGDELHFRRRGKSNEIFDDPKYSNDLRQGKYRRSFTYHDWDRDYLENNHDRHVPYSRLEGRNAGRNKRRFGGPVGLDYWSAGDDDGFLRCRDDPSVSSRSPKEPRSSSSRRFHDSKMPRNSAFYGQGKYRRQWSEKFRDGGSFGGYYNDLDTEESINNIDDRGHVGRIRHHSKAERLQWNEGQSISRSCGDKFHTKRAQFSFQRTSRQKKFDDLHESDHVHELIDDMHVNGGGIYKQIREGDDNGYQFDRTPNIIQSHEQMLLSCEETVVSDLVVVEGKHSGRSHERLEKKDQNVDADHKTPRNSDESFSETVAQVDKPEVETNRNDEKWLDKFPVTQDNEALEIEEGQIIAEGNIEVDAKEFLNQSKRNGKTVVEEYNNPRILEMMAKMEKRRERFKEPVFSSRKDSDNNETVTNKNLVVDSVDGTSTAKFQRPARKRRWGGR